MTIEQVIDLCRQTLSTALWVSAPVLILGVIVGLTVSIFQAATQIQEASLAFIPKLLAIGVALLAFGSWMLERLMTFTTAMISSAASIGGAP